MKSRKLKKKSCEFTKDIQNHFNINEHTVTSCTFTVFPVNRNDY